MKKFFGFLLILGVGYFASACDAETLEALNCTGCDADFPYSNSNASTCYTTKSGCEDAEGSTCVFCV